MSILYKYILIQSAAVTV